MRRRVISAGPGSLRFNPELLDWLATEFVRRGWSIKSMHRLLMTSEAYQMASAFDHPGIARRIRRVNIRGAFPNADWKPR